MSKENSYKCNFCKKFFKKEKTLQTHICEKKRRYLSKDDKYVKSGYISYCYWNKKANNAKKEKSFEDFIYSRLYNAFVNFGKYIVDTNIKNWEKYIDWLIINKVKIDDWSKDSVYYKFHNENIRREDAQRALERYLLFLLKWEEKTGNKWYEFWKMNSEIYISNLIIEGKISPWILFSDPKAEEFIENIPDELLIEIDRNIDLKFWKSKIDIKKEDSEWIRKMLTT